jgi:hypothetical protein
MRLSTISLIIFITLYSPCFAQTTNLPPGHAVEKMGLSIGSLAQFTKYKSSPVVLLGFETTLKAKDDWVIGAQFKSLRSTRTESTFTSEDSSNKLEAMFTSVKIGKIIFNDEQYNVTIYSNIGFGRVGYKGTTDKKDFLFIEPTIDFEYMFFSPLKFSTSLSWLFLNNAGINGLSEKDLSQLSVGFVGKIAVY